MYRVNKLIQSVTILFLMWLKKFKPFKSIILLTGKFEAHHYCKKTGKTTIDRLPVTMLNSMPFFNTVDNELLYCLAKVISTTGNAAWIGVNGLMTQASSDSKDGIIFQTSGDTIDYPTTTTKDSGGTGSSASVVFKAVRTAAGAEAIAAADLGIGFSALAGFGTEYATQTYAKTLASGDILTVYWTLTLS